MGLFPILNPIVPQPETPEVPQRPLGDEADPVINEIASLMNPYGGDLSQPLDPGLTEFNSVLAQKEQDVAQLEEADKALKTLVDLDKKSKTAQTSIHGTLSNYRQFLAQNANKLQGINLAHQLGMAAHQGEQQQQQAKFNGIVATRQQIANRMRGR